MAIEDKQMLMKKLHLCETVSLNEHLVALVTTSRCIASVDCG